MSPSRLRSLRAGLPIAALLVVTSPLAASAQPVARYRDPRLPVAVRARDLLGRMTLEEKFWQLFMVPGDLDDPSSDWSHGAFGLQIRMGSDTANRGLTPGELARRHALRVDSVQRYVVEHTRLGIPIIPFEEAVHGFVLPGGTMFPAAIALAATWDTTLMTRVAAAIARETRSRGVRQVLAPVVNIASDVRWGRVEETYGEDPVLASQMARAYVPAFERRGVIATPKHFVANVGEGGRDSYPIELSERALAERFYPPFEAAIRDAGARSVMTAYNSVDGSPATQNAALLDGLLKGAWQFRGFVISDAAATGGATVLHHTEANTATAAAHALTSGLDVIFQSSWPQHRPYLAAFRRGLVPDSVIDAAVLRVLTAKLELGLFEHPYANADSAAYWNGHPDHRALALEAARESIVLLANRRGTLPLAASVRTISIIGADATEARLGGYSGPGNDVVSILDGIRHRAARTGATVRYAPGPGRVSPAYGVVPATALSAPGGSPGTTGVHGVYFDNPRLEGAPRVRRSDPTIDFGWTLDAPAREIPFDWYSVRWTGTLGTPPGGVTRIGVEGNDGWRLWLDDTLAIDNWGKRSYGAHLTTVDWAPGSRHALRLEYRETTGNARVKLVWNAGIPDDGTAAIDSAVRVARASDIAVVVAGVEEGEFRDRSSLALPGRQEALIRAVAATGTPTVVVLVGGSAITMPWLDDVAAVLDAWYPGEAGGTAVAEVVFGDVSPAGRLPITFPRIEGQLPLYYDHKPTGRGDDYVDGSGQPLFPFGYGLSYTAFEYRDLVIEPATLTRSRAEATGAVVRFTITNTGQRGGDEVAQLYVHDVLASVARPVMQLAGFQRVRLAPGESKTVRIAVGPEQLRMLDAQMRSVVEPGRFRIMAGSSSKDIRLRGELVVQ